ncbi:hypothetical protein N8654_02190 [Synechococcus sp. AH-601-B19]|nr:hypothetical protein [Synechococcus sp. AH-601-B19]
MQIIASLRKLTKQGLSVWNFCYSPETKVYFAVGGCELKAIKADDRNHLRQIYKNFQSYGYAEKLPTKKAYISDPWSSQLPVRMQQELELLSA